MITHIHFQALPVTDTARARDFYRDKLGMTVERDNAYDGDRWVFMKIPGAQTLLHFDKCDAVSKSETPALILAVDDVDETCAGLRAKGVTIVSEPADAPWEPGTRWAYINDSEGNIVLIQTI